MIKCRGRNGWFTLHRLGALWAGHDTVHVFIESKQSNKTAPIVLEGPVGEVEQALKEMLTCVQDRFPEKENQNWAGNTAEVLP